MADALQLRREHLARLGLVLKKRMDVNQVTLKALGRSSLQGSASTHASKLLMVRAWAVSSCVVCPRQGCCRRGHLRRGRNESAHTRSKVDEALAVACVPSGLLRMPVARPTKEYELVVHGAPRLQSP